MIKHSISTLVLLCAMAVPCTAADYKGTAPKDGATYHLYNVGTGKFLSSADGTLTLGGTNLTVRLNKTADGYYTLTTADGKISATLWDAPRSNGSGKYSQWKFTKVKGTDDVYTLANRNREASATFSIYQDTTTGALALEAAQPGAQFTLAQWKLVASGEPVIEIVNIDETANSYTTPTESNATVKLKRTLEAGTWNTICLPFDISNEELKAKFGAKTQLAELTDADEEVIKFTTTTNGISAGETYIINPETVSANATYTFEGVNTFTSEPVLAGVEEVTITGSFTKTTAPAGAFTIINGKLQKYSEATAINGLRAYFTDGNKDSRIWTWSLDGVTGINATGINGTATYDMFNTAGQKVKTNATGKENMPKGIYIINGKKLTK